MKIIGGSKMVDLSKKLTVEMTLHELAVMAIGLGAISTSKYNDNVQNVVKAEFERGVTAQTMSCGETDYPYHVYRNLCKMLKAEGVAE